MKELGVLLLEPACILIIYSGVPGNALMNVVSLLMFTSESDLERLLVERLSERHATARGRDRATPSESPPKAAPGTVPSVPVMAWNNYPWKSRLPATNINKCGDRQYQDRQLEFSLTVVVCTRRVFWDAGLPLMVLILASASRMLLTKSLVDVMSYGIFKKK